MAAQRPIIRSGRSRPKGKGRAKQRPFNVIVERDEEGFYVASVPEWRGCHTQAKSFDTLLKRVREAIALCLETQKDAGPSSEFIGVQRVMVES